MEAGAHIGGRRFTVTTHAYTQRPAIPAKTVRRMGESAALSIAAAYKVAANAPHRNAINVIARKTNIVWIIAIYSCIRRARQ